MSYLKNIMQEESQRLEALCQKYSDKIAAYPKGTVSVKKRNKQKYLYLASRDNGKLKFNYVGSVVSEKAIKILEQVDIRKNYEKKLKQVKEDLKAIRKVIHGRKI